MRFHSYSNRIPTKADKSLIDGSKVSNIPQNASFGVYAYRHNFDGGDTGWTSALENGNARPLFMTNLKVTNTGTAASLKLEYSPSKYWPRRFAATGNIDPVSFFAYYPYDPASPTTFSGLPSFSFEVNADASKQRDFMISDLVKDMTYETIRQQGNPYVNLKFHHMLTSVVFCAKTPQGENADVEINDISLLSVYSKGTLICRESATQSVWNPAASIVNFSFPLAAGKTIGAQPQIISDTLLMLPQVLKVATEGKDTKLSITYTTTTKGTPSKKIKQTKILSLSTEDLYAWNKNQRVIYTITLGSSPIRFSANAIPWTEAREDDITIE